MSLEDWSISPLSILGMGLSAWLGHKNGKKAALAECEYRRRLEEIASLKSEIEKIKNQLTINDETR